ncbi:MAG: MFS transporter [Tenericutes bacterium]|nr:MFS transporter [Mycoplasmatota bacterium]
MDNQIAPRQNVFKNKNFALLFSGVLVSNIAFMLFNFVMSLYILRIAKEAFGAEEAPLIQGYYLLVSGIVLLILMPFGGALADRFNKAKTMYITDYIRGVIILSAGFVLYLSNSPETKILIIFCLAIILGINSAFFNPAAGSLLKFIVKDEELQQASSYLNGSRNLQNIIGLIFGGILYAILGIYVIFFICGIAYLISAITEMFIKYNVKAAIGKMTLKGIVKDIVVGVKYVYNFKPIFVLLMMALFLNFFTVPIFQNGLPYFIEFGLSSETSFLFDNFMTVENWYSVIMISASISGIIMAIVLSRREPKKKYFKEMSKYLVVFILVLVLISTVMILYYLELLNVNVLLIAIVLLLFIMGFASVGFNVPVGVTIQKTVDAEHLGKVQSVTGVLSQALIPIAGLIAGILISKVGILSLYIFCSIGVTVVIIWYLNNKYAKEI